eukprot:TRINITY_DN2890_c0_g1_i2.p1 TRINITY_DN2890_c0_g1~~TRINITY_DN2890_c0_g1_i2.p1  ORF type:complete len:2032 (+),score=608.70 TRINITY_DN2890_c0_g1_i2:72-6098(+)
MERSSSPNPAFLQGWMKKRGDDLLKGWKRRYFKQEEKNPNLLHYYERENDRNPLGHIDIKSVSQVTRDSKERSTFQVATTTGRTYVLQIEGGASEADEKIRYWTEGIEIWKKILLRGPSSENKPETAQSQEIAKIGSSSASTRATSSDIPLTVQSVRETSSDAIRTSTNPVNNANSTTLGSSLLSSSKPEKSSLLSGGWLKKMIGEESGGRSVLRHFRFEGTSLSYYKSDSSTESTGTIDLTASNARAGPIAGSNNRFEVVSGENRTVLEVTEDPPEENTRLWINSINSHIEKLKKGEIQPQQQSSQNSKQPNNRDSAYEAQETEKKEEQTVRAEKSPLLSQSEERTEAPPVRSRENLKGFLKKQGDDALKGWKTRYFKEEGNRLFYYKSNYNVDPLGFIDLSLLNRVDLQPNKHQIELVTEGRTYSLQTVEKDDSLYRYWSEGLKEIVEDVKSEKKKEREKENLEISAIPLESDGESSITLESLLASSPNSPKLLEGWLKKEGEDALKSVKTRYFKQEGTKIHYYRDENESNSSSSLGSIDLEEVNHVRTVGRDRFQIVTPKRVYHLEAYEKGSLIYWTEGIEAWIKIIKKQQRISVRRSEFTRESAISPVVELEGHSPQERIGNEIGVNKSTSDAPKETPRTSVRNSEAAIVRSVDIGDSVDISGTKDEDEVTPEGPQTLQQMREKQQNRSKTKPPSEKLMEKSDQKLSFQIRVHIIEARELQPRDRNNSSDPVCIVRVLNKKQNTSIHHKTTICTWDQLFFFEFSILPEEFLNGKVIVSVFDANTLLRDVEIGSFEFDLATIYDLDGHELYRKWVALSDKASKFQGVQGYLKLSITALGPGDTSPPHNEEEEMDEEEEGEDLQSMVLLPPSLTTVIHNLEINVYRAEGLPKMDTFGKCDGFLSVQFAANPPIKTKVKKNTYDPTWNETLNLPVSVPTMSDKIKVQLKDWDAASKADLIGTAYLKYSDLSSSKIDWNLPRWLNFYGAPAGISDAGLLAKNKIANKMNNGFLEGSSFRGRVLLAMKTRPLPDAKLCKNSITSTGLAPATSDYVIRLDLYEASELPTKKDITVELSIGSFKMSSKKCSVKNKNAQFFKSLDDVNFNHCSDPDQIPDVFLNIYKYSITNKKQRIGYVRLKASDFVDKGDRNTGSATDIVEVDVLESGKTVLIGGFLQYRLRIIPSKFLYPRQQIERPKMKRYQLRAFLYQAKDLPAGDANGASDPYCIIRVGKSSIKTKTVKETCFPLWYESLCLDCEIPEDKSQSGDIQITVWDWDKLSADDLLGRFSVPFSSINEKFQNVPSWYPIYLKTPDRTEGAVLCSFQLIPYENVDKYLAPPDITPKFKDCILEVSVVGLREMIPFRLLPMQKPFVQINCGSEAKVTTRTSTSPKSSSPNYLEVIRLDVKIPEDVMFAPPINIKVIDDRLVYKPIVGVRSISTTPFIPWNSGENSKDIMNESERPSLTVPDDALHQPKPEISEESTNKDGKEEISTTDPKGSVDEVSISIKEESENGKEEVTMEVVPISDNKKKKTKDDLERENQSQVENFATSLFATAQKRLLPEVAASFLSGAEDEVEEEKDLRETLKGELESFLKEPTFGLLSVYRAKSSRGISRRIEVGKFKGKFRIIEKSQIGKVDPPMDLIEMFRPTDYTVRVYVLEGYQFVAKDSDGKNNPYVTIKNGDKKVKDVNDKKQGTARPLFYKCYEMICSFPEHNNHQISIYDYNKYTKHDLIGTTKIDLENRLFSSEWKNMERKPMEYRTLWSPSSNSPQGQLKMWVDIMTQEEARRNPPIPIALPVPLEMELRLIVWETKEVVFADKKCSDIFVTAYPEGQKPQVTDTHWRSEDGKGSFNWRMIFPVTIPSALPKFKLQIWDKDILTPDDAICEANLNLRPFYKKAFKNKSSRESLSKQWISMTHPSAQGVQGKIQVSFELLSLDEASRFPAGLGRKEPNDNPFLPKPDRPETSFNPFRLDKQFTKILWGRNKKKVFACLFVTLLVVVLIIVLKFVI